MWLSTTREDYNEHVVTCICPLWKLHHETLYMSLWMTKGGTRFGVFKHVNVYGRIGNKKSWKNENLRSSTCVDTSDGAGRFFTDTTTTRFAKRKETKSVSFQSLLLTLPPSLQTLPRPSNPASYFPHHNWTRCFSFPFWRRTLLQYRLFFEIK